MDIESIEKICKSLPHVTAEIKWKSDLVFMIATKMFCVIDLDAIPTSVAFNAGFENFEALSISPNFKPAPYFAQHKWVTVVDIGKISYAGLQSHINTSYQLVREKLSKKTLQELER